METIFKFELRDEVKDTITGFAGVITARIQWLNGCVRYMVSSRTRNKDGKTVEDTIDEQQLVYLHPPKAPKVPKEEKKKPGGPFPEPAKFNTGVLKI